MTQKIVINACFGGFSLSPLAVKRMAELHGKECYFFQTNFVDKKLKTTACSLEEAERAVVFCAYSTPTPPETPENWRELPLEERQKLNQEMKEISIENRDISRDDPVLVQVVEELEEGADGRCAELKVVSIPDEIEWQIEEHDGFEHVAQKHETWS